MYIHMHNNTYLLGYLHDTTVTTMSVVPTMRRRKATLGQLRQQISCYLQYSTYYIHMCIPTAYDNDKDAVIYLVAVKTPSKTPNKSQKNKRKCMRHCVHLKKEKNSDKTCHNGNCDNCDAIAEDSYVRRI